MHLFSFAQLLICHTGINILNAVLEKMFFVL